MNSLIRIAKEFHWEMAHRLPYHTAGCQNIHGHSYRVMVEVEGTPLANGMLMDYSDLKAIVKPIVDELDHGFMCSADDELMKTFVSKTTLKVIHVPFYTTAENLAIYFAERIRPKLRDAGHLKRLSVRICETLSTYADISINL